MVFSTWNDLYSVILALKTKMSVISSSMRSRRPCFEYWVASPPTLFSHLQGVAFLIFSRVDDRCDAFFSSFLSLVSRKHRVNSAD